MTSLQHFYTHPSQKTTTVNNVTSTFGHLKNFVHKRTNLATKESHVWTTQFTKSMAGVLQKLSFVRLKSEPNVNCYIMVYVNDLLVLGDKTAVDSTFKAVQKQVLLKRIGHLEPGKPQQFLGRNIDHFGNYCNLGLKDSYIDNMTEESGMTNCNTVTAPGIAHYNPTIEDEALLDHKQHKRYRRIVGKLQWLAYTRPDIAYSTKEMARDLTAPTELSQKRVKHLLRTCMAPFTANSP